MLFGAKNRGQADVLLKPFVLKLREGYLIGLGMEPEKGSPCIECAEKWLTGRNVFVERIPVSQLSLRRDLLIDLIAQNNAHVYHEIATDGTTTRMDCMVFPHPECRCNKENFVPPVEVTKKTNFAFSPMFQIKCARYGTPGGNLWLTRASGEIPGLGKKLEVFGGGNEREISRLKAVDEWMKRSSIELLRQKAAQPGEITAQDFRTGNHDRAMLSPLLINEEGLGSGPSERDAVLDALHSFALSRTVRKFGTQVKNPMLIVGTNNWVRGRVPFSLLQQYDLHLLFYPNSTPSWVVGVAALSRQKTDEAPVFVFASGPDVVAALDGALAKMLNYCRPSEWMSEEEIEEAASRPESVSRQQSKLNLWWTHWIYRCAKISLKDVLHLEAYPDSFEMWQNYFNDGQEKLSILRLNTPLLPEKLRHLIKVYSPSQLIASQPGRNINGIGTWNSLQLR